ncbi:MAG TPA: DUF1302 family protein [Burkholderiales bacterium]|nr:DUF1302 family protein [Burkholderiales bacterium]
MAASWLRQGAAAALVLCVSLAGAEDRDLGLTGALRLNHYRSSKTFDDERDLLGATFQAKASPALADGVDGKLSLRITDPAIGEGGAARGRLLEGFAALRGDRAELRLGRQIVAWGRADGINPTDNLTPRDYTVLLPFEDDQRLGTDSARLDFSATHEHTLSVFATPFFEPSRIPLPRQASFQERRPRESLEEAQVGIRLNKAGESLDWSVSYFRGHSLLPTLRPVAPNAAGGVLTYDAIRVLGADFARNFGRYGFRGEMAYLRSEDRAGEDPFARNPQLYWVLGVDRTFLENLNLNVQLFQRRVRAHRPADLLSAPTERTFALQSALLSGQRDRINSGITLRASNKWLNDSLEAEIFLIRNSTRRDLFLRPLVTYAFSDHLKGTVGIEYYRGAEDTQFGSQTANKGGFVELRYSF